MEFPDLVQAKEKITDLFFAEQEMAADDVCVIASPYRICPLGAHIDHQGGPVLGMTINAYTLLAFAPTADGTVRLKSKNYPGKVAFELDRIPETTGGSWGVYARAAALALKETYPINKGVSRTSGRHASGLRPEFIRIGASGLPSCFCGCQSDQVATMGLCSPHPAG